MTFTFSDVNKPVQNSRNNPTDPEFDFATSTLKYAFLQFLTLILNQ